MVAPAHTIPLRMPEEEMLCTLNLEAVTTEGKVINRNFVHFFVSQGYPSRREERPDRLILRQAPWEWSSAEWSGRMRTRERARAEDCCFGHGHGHFEWTFALENADLRRAHSVRVLCEASSRRSDTAQTDEDLFPTHLHLLLNGVRIHEGTLPNHPHDSRGVLSYLRGGRGAYGYLANATLERELLHTVASRMSGGSLQLRFEVPQNATAQGGLTVYGSESGRYPLCPTIILEW
jgi:hypothetical protein